MMTVNNSVSSTCTMAKPSKVGYYLKENKGFSQVKLNKKLIDRSYFILKVHDEYIYFANNDMTVRIVHMPTEKIVVELKLQ